MLNSMPNKKTEVGSPMNFRGFMYQPINEQGVVYLFSLIAKDLNIIVESIQQGYPDCTALRYVGGDRWERIRIEFEFKSSRFNHDLNGCDMIVCWENDFNEEMKSKISEAGIEILELKSIINTPEIPNQKPESLEEIEKSEYDLAHHFVRSNVNDNVKPLYNKLHEEILKINSEIFRKFSRTAITYYSPEKMFIFIRLQKTSVKVDIYTNRQDLEDVRNYTNHENWGTSTIFNERDIENLMPSIKQSYEIMKRAVKDNINTGWFALTPREHLEEENEGEKTPEEVEEN